MSWYAKQDRCGDGPGHNALVLLAGANKGQSTSNVLSACPRARMHIFEIVPKLFEQQQKRFKDSPWVTVHRRGWSDTRLLLEGLTCKFTYNSGITPMQRITCCLYFGSLSQAMKCYKLHKIQTRSKPLCAPYKNPGQGADFSHHNTCRRPLASSRCCSDCETNLQPQILRHQAVSEGVIRSLAGLCRCKQGSIDLWVTTLKPESYRPKQLNDLLSNP